MTLLLPFLLLASSIQTPSHAIYMDFDMGVPTLSPDGSMILGSATNSRSAVWTEANGFRYVFDNPAIRGIATWASQDGSVVLTTSNGPTAFDFRTVKTDDDRFVGRQLRDREARLGPLAMVNATGETVMWNEAGTCCYYRDGYSHALPCRFQPVHPGGKDGSFVGYIKAQNPINGVGAVMKPGNVLKVLGQYCSYARTEVRAGNANSTVFAGLGSTDNMARRPFIWTEPKGFVDLPAPRGASVDITSMSQDGRMVFGMILATPKAGGGPVVWIDGKAPIPLMSYLKAADPKIPDVSNGGLVDSSDDGLTFIFSRYDRRGYRYIHLAKAPELPKTDDEKDGSGG